MNSNIQVFQIDVKVYLLKDIRYIDSLYTLGCFLNKALSLNEQTLELHTKKEFKGYCFNNLVPLECDKVYKEGKVYTFSIRTIKKELAEHFAKVLPDVTTNEMKGLVANSTFIPKRPIEKLYSITYCIIKTDFGYWKKNKSLDEFEKRVNDNCDKKYQYFTGNKERRERKFYHHLQFLNKKVIAMNYKNISLLGDKIELCIDADEEAQDMAYMLLGVGLCENNANGGGYVNYKGIEVNDR